MAAIIVIFCLFAQVILPIQREWERKRDKQRNQNALKIKTDCLFFSLSLLKSKIAPPI